MIATPSFFVPIVAAALASAWVAPAQASEAEFGATRADIRASVIQARAAGELMPTGERSFFLASGRGTGSRAEVKAAVLQAMAHGELMRAGDRPTPFVPAQSLRMRADVKDEVMQAKASGRLIAAGERLSSSEPASDPARVYRPRPEMTASSRR